MKKLLLLALLVVGDLYAIDIRPYVSPGIQIGINTAGDFFYSYQVTLGLFNNNFKWEKNETNQLNKSKRMVGGEGLGKSKRISGGEGLGITFGKRIFYNPNKRSYTYIDAQISMLVMGLGFGKIFDDVEKFNKYKLWIGSLGLISYDYINFTDNIKYHFSFFGVMPLMDHSSGK